MADTALIEVVAGPDSGKSVTLEPGATVVVGRGEGVDLLLEDRAFSRRHLAIENRADGIFVRDLGSKHGANVDGRAIPKEGALVPFRAVVEVGKTRLLIARVVLSEKEIVPPPGLVLGEKLGEGEQGVSYRAFQDPPGRHVSVKVVRSGSNDRAQLVRLRREVELQRRLDHPSIVRVYGLLECEDAFFVLRELIAGHTLDDELGRGPLPWKRVVAIGATVADALAHAHERGVVHRDVKPGNVFVEEPSGTIRLADFDMARDAERRATVDGTALTRTGDGTGTISYHAPEQFTGAKDAGPPADVYSLSAVLYHALSNVRPFSDVSPYDYVRALFHGPKPLDAIAPHVPAPVRAAVARGMSPLYEARPDAATFARELRALESK